MSSRIRQAAAWLWQFRIAALLALGAAACGGMAVTSSGRVEASIWTVSLVVVVFAFAYDVLLFRALGGWDGARDTLHEADDLVRRFEAGAPFVDEHDRIWRCASKDRDEQLQRYLQIVSSPDADHLVRLTFQIHNWMAAGAVVEHKGQRYRFALDEQTDRYRLVAEPAPASAAAQGGQP